jgi:hypothetical protein
MPLTSKDLDELQRLSEAVDPGTWVSLIEGRDIESGSSFIQVNEGHGPVGDIEITLVPGRDSGVDLHGVGHEKYTKYLDLIAAARSSLPILIDEVRQLRREVDAASIS